MKPKVVLVEDHLSYRQSLSVALTQSGRFQVAAEAGGVREAVAVLERIQPDITVADFILSDSDAVSLARELRRRRLRTPMLILAASSHPFSVQDAQAVGIQGYVLKSEPLAEIMVAMETLAAGGRHFSAHLQAPDPDNGTSVAFSTLSSRQREIFWRLLQGLSSKEIAGCLYIAQRTVDGHRLHINRKLGVRTPSELAVFIAGLELYGRC